MFIRIILTFCLIISLSSCNKKEVIYEPSNKVDPYVLYKEGLDAIKKNDFFSQKKNFLKKS